jgi:alpha,alpha-trehalase
MKDRNNTLLTYKTYDPDQQGLREALCTLGNGYFATRGAFPEEDADEVHYPGTYLAGGYNRLSTEIAGRTIENEDLVNFPNWLSLKFRIEKGDWFQLKAVEIESFKQQLDLKQGILERIIIFKDAHGRRTTLDEKRFVHMKHYHLAAIQRTVTAENWSGTIEILSALDGRVINHGVARYRELNSRHLEPLASGTNDKGHLYLKVRTSQSELHVAQAAKHNLYLNGARLACEPDSLKKVGYTAQNYKTTLKQGDSLTIEKVVAMYTSKDAAISEPLYQAELAISHSPSFDELERTHANMWNLLWRQFDIEIETADESAEDTHSLMVLRLHIFHLLQTVSYNTLDIDSGVPARGWHGEAYRGHIFWDELYIFPLLNLRIPKITLALLKYRFRRLDAARALAKEEGLRGAMYPWQSGSDGREESQKVHLNPKSGRWIPDYSNIQRHVNLAIAYNVWRYFETTNDMDFLRSFGAEMILEIARLFDSLCTYNDTLDRYEIHKVMGPDEYHDAYPDSEEPGLSNNGYTNVMTAWLMARAVEVLHLLPEDHHRELCTMLEIKPEEVDRWQSISHKMRVVFHSDGVISQFEGYEQLKEFDWEGYTKKYKDIQRLDRILEAEGDSPNRYKLSKQADTLMLFYLFTSSELQDIFNRLDYPFTPDLIPKNINYYLERTCHGSTLSRIVHSWVLSREDRYTSWSLFLNALKSDVADIQGGTTQEGIHLGSMAGTVDIVQRCYAGIEPRRDALWLNPCLPEALERMRFHVHYRGHSLEMEITRERLRIISKFSMEKEIQIGFKDETYSLQPGDVKEFPLTEKSVI